MQVLTLHEVKSAKVDEELPPKCKNCTLEEVAVLRVVQKKPSATQKEIATEIEKSERTVQYRRVGNILTTFL